MHQLDSGRIGPVQVIENEHERSTTYRIADNAHKLSGHRIANCRPRAFSSGYCDTGARGKYVSNYGDRGEPVRCRVFNGEKELLRSTLEPLNVRRARRKVG